MATKAPVKVPETANLKSLIEKLREVEKNAKHAADPREPAAQVAAALAEYFEGK